MSENDNPWAGIPASPTREKPPGIRKVKKPKYTEAELMVRRARESDTRGMRKFMPRFIRRHVPQKRS